MEGETTEEVYKECLRNHAASLGSYATDGCGEFTLSFSSSSSSSAAPLQCAACGCHRNFHRKVNSNNNHNPLLTTAAILDDHPQIMMAAAVRKNNTSTYRGNPGKRHRTKFTAEQKEKMTEFAEKIGWRLTRVTNKEEDEVERFCRGVGISRQVFKVWMHNHKNSSSSSTTNINHNYDLSNDYINVASFSTRNNASSLTTQ
ncbi:Zinc-finger homeodomain protein 3 [Linum grandiflorum]